MEDDLDHLSSKYLSLLEATFGQLSFLKMAEDSGPGYIASLVLGNIGVALLVIIYLLLQVGKVQAEQLIYSIVNLIGAALIGVSLFFRFNIPSAAIESCWILFSIVGIIRWFRKRFRNKTQTTNVSSQESKDDLEKGVDSEARVQRIVNKG